MPPPYQPLTKPPSAFARTLIAYTLARVWYLGDVPKKPVVDITNCLSDQRNRRNPTLLVIPFVNFTCNSPGQPGPRISLP